MPSITQGLGLQILIVFGHSNYSRAAVLGPGIVVDKNIALMVKGFTMLNKITFINIDLLKPLPCVWLHIEVFNSQLNSANSTEFSVNFNYSNVFKWAEGSCKCVCKTLYQQQSCSTRGCTARIGTVYRFSKHAHRYNQCFNIHLQQRIRVEQAQRVYSNLRVRVMHVFCFIFHWLIYNNLACY